eukprot:1029042-Amphidinium_carterae.1
MSASTAPASGTELQDRGGHKYIAFQVKVFSKVLGGLSDPPGQLVLGGEGGNDPSSDSLPFQSLHLVELISSERRTKTPQRNDEFGNS